jgi:hypothetical protein
MWQVTTFFLLRVAQQLIHAAAGAGAGALNAVWMGLAQPPTGALNQYSTLAQITEANYDGYSRQQVVWFPPWISVAGPELLTAQDLWFSPSDALVSNQITWIFLADAFYAGNLLMAAPVPNPGVNLSSPAQALKVQAQFALPFTQIFGKPDLVY